MGLDRAFAPKEESAPEAVNDNESVTRFVDSMKERLSDRAWKLFELLYEAEDQAAFEDGIRFLNALTDQDQLQTGSEMRGDKANADNAFIGVTIPIHTGKHFFLLKAKELHSGRYEFEAA